MMEEQLFTPYNGTGGYVERVASRDRALNELETGLLSERQQRVLRELERIGREGATWVELGERLGLHHGQISGVLSNLHKKGLVFALTKTVNGCHPYIYFAYSDWYRDIERTDTPAETAAGRRKRALDEVLAAARQVVTFDGTERDSLEWLRSAILAVDSQG